METDNSCENMVKEIDQFSDYLSNLNPYQIAKLNDYINRCTARIYADINLRLLGSQQLYNEGKITKDQILTLDQMKSEDLLRYERVYGLIEQHEIKLLREQLQRIQEQQTKSEIPTLEQIALICHYNKFHGSEKELQQKAIEYRGKENVSPSTGEQIQKKLDLLYREIERIGKRRSVNNISTILTYLNGQALQNANIDLDKAKAIKKG
jgi:hypothetical protein